MAAALRTALDSKEMICRFREATVGLTSHPNIVEVLDMGSNNTSCQEFVEETTFASSGDCKQPSRPKPPGS